MAALPYDVYSRSEAKKAVEGKPLSFLNIDRPETQYDESFDMYSAKAYETARDMLKAEIKDGTFITDEERAYYVYELTMDGRRQTGIVACCAIDDYVNGVIKKHENTLAAKEQDRINHIRTTGAQTGPIFLAYRANAQLREIINVTKETPALYDFTADDGIAHRVWKIDAKYTAEVEKIFDGINAIYIADGHHRAASAVKVGLEKREQLNDAPCQRAVLGDEAMESEYFMSVLFADEELKILPYNRVVKAAVDMEELGKIFEIEKEDAPGELNKGQINLYADHQWYRLTVKPEFTSEDPVDGLDVSILQNHVLDPMFGIKDPKTDPNVKFVGGIRGDGELVRLVDSGEWNTAFSMYPTQMSELLAVADAGRLMPPKSTWFEPKLRSGLFIHRI